MIHWRAFFTQPRLNAPLKILLFANTDWYLYNFRRSLAVALRDAGYEVLLVSPPGAYGAQLQALGFRWFPAPMQRRSLNPLREMALLYWLYKLIRAERVDLVHAFTLKCVVYGAIAARMGGVSRVNAATGMGYVFTSNDLKARCLRPLVRGLMRLALGGRNARLILQNPDDVALFKRAGLVSAEQIRLIPGSGVDCRRFTPGPRQLAESAEKVVDGAGRLRLLLPARLLWDKGLAEYIEAIRLLKAQGRDIEFLLAGDPDPGNPAAVPLATINAWVQEGLVKSLGHVDDMPALFNSVDVVVLPSYREGLPKGLIEAGACGLALVTTDVPGCREVVTNDVDGLLVPVKNAEALAQAIARLQDNSALRQRLGAAARAKVLAEFDEKIVIEKTLVVYRELLPQ